MKEKDVDVNGTLIWYYHMCKREVWLMAHQLTPDQQDKNIAIGRFIHENSYKRAKKEITFGNVKFDIMKKGKTGLIVAEVKKSSKYERASKMQLAYYLLQLDRIGIKAKGEYRVPSEKKKEIILLDDQLIDKLEKLEKEILKIIYSKLPPKPKKIKLCGKCGYNEFCWS